MGSCTCSSDKELISFLNMVSKNFCVVSILLLGLLLILSSTGEAQTTVKVPEAFKQDPGVQKLCKPVCPTWDVISNWMICGYMPKLCNMCSFGMYPQIIQ